MTVYAAPPWPSLRNALAVALTLFLCLCLMSSTALAQLPALSATPTDESSATAENARLLADILRDQQAREALIQELVRIAEGAKGSEQAETATAPVESSSFARTVAEYSVEFAQSSLQRLEGVRDWALQFYGALFAKDGRTLRGLGDAALSLVLVIGSTMAVFLGLALLAQAIYRWFAARSEGAGWVRRAASILFSVVVDAVVVLLAWACGYALAIFAIGETGSLDVVESLYLNAFLIVESVRVLMRGALAPRYGSLRVLSMSDTSAAYWYFWASRLVALLGYGFLLAMPIVRATFPPGVAEGVGLLIGFSALILVILLVLQNRQSVRERLERRGSEDTSEYLVSAQNGLARSWHVLAILYFIGLFMVWSTRPEGALTLMLRASGESLLMITLGVLLMTLISRFVTGGMRLPADVKARLPLLELRLNAFVPTVLKVVRPIILVVVVMLVANAWGLFDFFGWIASEGGRELVSRVFGVAFVTVLAFFLWLAISSWVEYRLNPNYGRPPTARERTLLALLRNAATIAIVAVAAMIVLSEIGVNIGPLLAGAGVLGLAVGFGAQKLVQDIITGIFIQFENAINEGDVITVAGLTGAVDRLTIRSVSLRDLNGTYHIVPFSSVDSVSNFMRGFAYHVAEVGFAYREDTEQTKAVMHRAFDELNSNEDYARYIIGPLEWHGVTQLGDSAVVQRARIKTIPGQQWGVGRAYSEIVKRLCDEAGIEIPYPHTTVYFGEDKCGEAPPLRVRLPQDFTAKTTANGANMSAPSPD